MDARRRWWLALAVGAVATTALYAVGLGPLEALLRGRGHGIVDLELAWTTGRAGAITSAWAADGVSVARQQVWWDFAWIPSYGLTLWAALRLATIGARGRLRRWAGLALVAVPVAGLLDVLENVGLLSTLHGPVRPLVVAVTSALASAKFALLVLALGVLGWGLVARLRGRNGPARVR